MTCLLCNHSDASEITVDFTHSFDSHEIHELLTIHVCDNCCDSYDAHELAYMVRAYIQNELTKHVHKEFNEKYSDKDSYGE